MGFLKKRPPHAYTPGQMLQILAELRLVALLQHNSVWLAVEPRVAWLLDVCCMGQKDGGPGTAREVAAVLGLQLATRQEVHAAAAAASPAPMASPAPVASSEQRGTGDQQQEEQQQEQQGGEQEQAEGPASKRQRLDEQGARAAAGDQGSQDALASTPMAVKLQDQAQDQQQQAVEQQQNQQAEQDVQGQEAPQQEQQAGVQPEQQADGTQQQGEETAPDAPADGPASTAQAAGSEAAAGEGGRDGQSSGRGRGGRGGGRGRGGRGGGGGRGRGSDHEPWRSLPHAFVAVRLTLEETFFLQYVLGCLQVMEPRGGADGPAPSLPAAPAPAAVAATTATADVGQAGSGMEMDHERADGQGDGAQMPAGGEAAGGAAQVSPINDEELWSLCCRLKDGFAMYYAAYLHLKSKGWLPRSGLLYGCDYVLYQLHPGACHSRFAVRLVPLGSLAQRVASQGSNSWVDLQITARCVGTVAKRLILLFIQEDPSSPGHATPSCVDYFQVEERVIRRWVPDSTRD